MPLRQVAPPDPALTFDFPKPVPAKATLRDRPEAEAIPAHVRLTKGGLEIDERTLVDALTSPTAAPTPGAVGLWPTPTPTFTYLAGAAGSGKTFATKEWAEQEEGLVLCATTGIAAINLGGETINSILGYFDTASLQEAYITGSLTARIGRLWKSKVRRLIIDEVSMLSGDQLGFLVRAIEEANTKDYILKSSRDDDDGPPPAMGLTLVGDFCQLPPVKAPFAFEAAEWDRFKPEAIRTLTEIRRQADPAFIEMLRAARKGDGVQVAEFFESRGLIQQQTDDSFDGPTVLAKNENVDRYNALRMQRLPGTVITFRSARWGKQRSEWGNPQKPPATWGIPEQLPLKEGALVMVLANRRVKEQVSRLEEIDEWSEVESSGTKRLLYVNGDLGTLVGAGEEIVFRKEDGTPVYARAAYVQLQRTGKVVTVLPVERQVKVPCDSARRKELREQGKGDLVEDKWEIVGEIAYMPLRVAYATTVHKSQGLSLDKVQVNISDGFFKAAGMVYVALSRARTLEGLRLVGSRAALVERCTSDHRLTEWL